MTRVFNPLTPPLDRVRDSSEIDHDQTANTHNLTTDIDHTAIQNIGSNSHATIDTHLGSSSNPHSVTANQVLPDQSGHSGEFLTTDGSDPSWAAAGGGGNKIYRGYDWSSVNSSEIYAVYPWGSSTVTYQANMVRLLGTTNGDYCIVWVRDDTFQYLANNWNLNPKFDGLIYLYTTANGTGTVSTTVGHVIWASTYTWTNDHMGFYKVISGGANYIAYASNADDSAQTKTDVSATFTAYYAVGEIVMTSGTNIKFYLDGTLVATHTTNLPADQVIGYNVIETAFDIGSNHVFSTRIGPNCVSIDGN